MILVVGGAGYIGSHVNKILTQRGYSTVVLDNLSTGHYEAVKWGKFIYGDLSDTILLDKIFAYNEIEAVMHFSAFAYVGESVDKPMKYYNNNVINTLHLLDAMMRYGVRDFVFSSTCATYGEPDHMPITEDMRQCPVNPYGRSKLMVEQIMEDYHIAYGLRYTSLRYFNAAGDDPDGEIGELHRPETHLIPLVLDAALGRRAEIVVFGTDYSTKDGTCVRDYIHVNDLADAHIRALSYIRDRNTSECFNLGNGTGYSVKEIIETACKITGCEIPIRLAARRIGDPSELVGSYKKAADLLGWEPKFDLTQILKTAWQWQKKITEVGWS